MNIPAKDLSRLIRLVSEARTNESIMETAWDSALALSWIRKADAILAKYKDVVAK